MGSDGSGDDSEEKAGRSRFFAHSGTPGDKRDWQGLREHSWAVAKLAAAFASIIGLQKAAYLAGLLHDLGKYNSDFQRRLEGIQLRVDHSTAGAAILDGTGKGFDAVTVQLVMYAILGHHAGLPDMENEHGHCFKRRIKEFQNRLDPAWRAEVVPDVAELAPAALMQAIATQKHSAFDLSVLARFIFSCLVDADYKDTEAFYARLEGRALEREWPSLEILLPELGARFDAYMARFDGMGPIDGLRRDILAHVRGKAALSPGLYTLTVPTGGGKTLVTMGFALDHARHHGHRRIIYAIPFTSVTDQVARVFRDVLGAEHILEHHSAIEEEREDRKANPTTRDRMKLAMEDWAAAIVVTTNVQFFESLFAARTSRARKLHNIAGSIIVLDEAQTIPRPLLRPCVRMLDALARHFKCTIVLCTATQPALGAPRFADGLDLDDRELAPDPDDLARRLRRTRIERVGEMDDAALVAALAETPQGLVIVNSRRHALDLFRGAKTAGLDGVLHLSTRQCAAHRREILDDVRARLKAGRPCRLIATSVVEAGVDLDFPRGWRAEAGLDSIIQAAGRVNREGRRAVDASVVTVFRPTDHNPPQEVKSLIADMGRMVDDHGDDLQSLAAIDAYFGEVYWRQGVKGLDAEGILDAFRVSREGTSFAFREVAEKFRMIEDGGEPVIIVRDEISRKAVDELSVAQLSSVTLARKLQSYVVQVPRNNRCRLIEAGHVAFERPDLRGDQFAVLQNASRYDPEVGLLWEDAEILGSEDSVWS